MKFKYPVQQSSLPPLDMRALYDRFAASVTALDCGKKCAPHNPNGIPFCCDICQAVPVGYRQEWDYLQGSTNLWKQWRGDECPEDPSETEHLLSETPDHLLLLACQGPAHCQRSFRAMSCRQFPFFPYITRDDRFIGLAYAYEYEANCWVISHLDAVTAEFRDEFVQTYEDLFARWEEEFDSYAIYSDEARAHFTARKRRIPLLHRNGGYYLISPDSERMQRVTPARFPRFDPYKVDE